MVSGGQAARPGRWRPWLGRVLHECLTSVAHFGNAVSGVSGFLLPYTPAVDEPAGAPVAPVVPAAPPARIPALPGHPERLVPHVPLSPAERWLAAQLD